MALLGIVAGLLVIGSFTPMMAALEAARASWVDGTWNGNVWTGRSWTGTDWTGRSWSGDVWATGYWG